LERVSTVRGSGWVRSRAPTDLITARLRLRTHPLPRTVLTRSKHDDLTSIFQYYFLN